MNLASSFSETILAHNSSKWLASSLVNRGTSHLFYSVFVRVPLMRRLPSFAAHELMDISDEAAVLRDDDRHPGFRWNFTTAMKTERMCFLRE
jgi:hypothetical protein